MSMSTLLLVLLCALIVTVMKKCTQSTITVILADYETKAHFQDTLCLCLKTSPCA